MSKRRGFSHQLIITRQQLLCDQYNRRGELNETFTTFVRTGRA